MLLKSRWIENCFSIRFSAMHEWADSTDDQLNLITMKKYLHDDVSQRWMSLHILGRKNNSLSNKNPTDLQIFLDFDLVDSRKNHFFFMNRWESGKTEITSQIHLLSETKPLICTSTNDKTIHVWAARGQIQNDRSSNNKQ